MGAFLAPHYFLLHACQSEQHNNLHRWQKLAEQIKFCHSLSAIFKVLCKGLIYEGISITVASIFPLCPWWRWKTTKWQQSHKSLKLMFINFIHLAFEWIKKMAAESVRVNGTKWVIIVLVRAKVIRFCCYWCLFIVKIHQNIISCNAISLSCLILIPVFLFLLIYSYIYMWKDVIE